MDAADPLTESETPDEQIEAMAAVPPAARRGMARRIVGGTFNYGLGQALPQLMRFFLTWAFSFVLLPADYGVLELAGTFTALMTQFMRLGVPGAVTRFYFDHREGKALTDYVTTIAIFLLGSSVVIGLATMALGPWLFECWVPKLDFYPFGLLALGTAVVSCNQNLQDRLVQAREQSSYMAVLNVLRAVISIGFALFFVLAMRWGAYGVLLAELTAAALIFVQAGRYLLPNLRGRFQRAMLRTSLIYGLGVLPSHMVYNLSLMVTNGILADNDFDSLGLLGFARKWVLPLGMLASAFQTAFTPIYFAMRSDHSEKNVATLVRMARLVWAAAILVAIGGALLIPPIIRLLTPAEYHESATFVPIMVITFLAQAVNVVFGTELYFSKKTYLVPIMTASSAVVAIVITLLTVEKYGAMGVAWANALGAVALTISGVLLSRRLVKIPHEARDLLRLAGCGVAVVAVAWLLTGQSMVGQFVIGALAMAAFPTLLWLCGDPTVNETAKFVKQRLDWLQASG